MKKITVDKDQVAYCGLYCGACRKYLVGKCPGCHGNEKASWCKIRKCCMENGFSSCAECEDYSDVMDCKWFNNFVAKFFYFVFKSDRESCIKRIGEVGLERFAQEMTEKKQMSYKRK